MTLYVLSSISSTPGVSSGQCLFLLERFQTYGFLGPILHDSCKSLFFYSRPREPDGIYDKYFRCTLVPECAIFRMPYNFPPQATISFIGKIRERVYKSSRHTASSLGSIHLQAISSWRPHTVILELRLYAMYSSSRKILWLFILMTLSEASVMGVVVGMPVPGLRGECPFFAFLGLQAAPWTVPYFFLFIWKGTNSPSPGLFICADGDPIRRHWVSYYWTSLLITESILLSLSVYKAYVFQRTGAGGNLMRILTRDSVLYFILYVDRVRVGGRVY